MGSKNMHAGVDCVSRIVYNLSYISCMFSQYDYLLRIQALYAS